MNNLTNDFIEKIANDCVDVYNDCERTQYYPKEKMIKNRIEYVGIVLNKNFENGISNCGLFELALAILALYSVLILQTSSKACFSVLKSIPN